MGSKLERDLEHLTLLENGNKFTEVIEPYKKLIKFFIQKYVKLLEKSPADKGLEERLKIQNYLEKLQKASIHSCQFFNFYEFIQNLAENEDYLRIPFAKRILVELLLINNVGLLSAIFSKIDDEVRAFEAKVKYRLDLVATTRTNAFADFYRTAICPYYELLLKIFRFCSGQDARDKSVCEFWNDMEGVISWTMRCVDIPLATQQSPSLFTRVVVDSETILALNLPAIGYNFDYRPIDTCEILYKFKSQISTVYNFVSKLGPSTSLAEILEKYKVLRNECGLLRLPENLPSIWAAYLPKFIDSLFKEPIEPSTVVEIIDNFRSLKPMFPEAWSNYHLGVMMYFAEKDLEAFDFLLLCLQSTNIRVFELLISIMKSHIALSKHVIIRDLKDIFTDMLARNPCDMAWRGLFVDFAVTVGDFDAILIFENTDENISNLHLVKLLWFSSVYKESHSNPIDTSRDAIKLPSSSKVVRALLDTLTQKFVSLKSCQRTRLTRQELAEVSAFIGFILYSHDKTLAEKYLWFSLEEFSLSSTLYFYLNIVRIDSRRFLEVVSSLQSNTGNISENEAASGLELMHTDIQRLIGQVYLAEAQALVVKENVDREAHARQMAYFIAKSREFLQRALTLSADNILAWNSLSQLLIESHYLDIYGKSAMVVLQTKDLQDQWDRPLYLSIKACEQIMQRVQSKMDQMVVVLDVGKIYYKLRKYGVAFECFKEVFDELSEFDPFSCASFPPYLSKNVDVEFLRIVSVTELVFAACDLMLGFLCENTATNNSEPKPPLQSGVAESQNNTVEEVLVSKCENAIHDDVSALSEDLKSQQEACLEYFTCAATCVKEVLLPNCFKYSKIWCSIFMFELTIRLLGTASSLPSFILPEIVELRTPEEELLKAMELPESFAGLDCSSWDILQKIALKMVLSTGFSEAFAILSSFNFKSSEHQHLFARIALILNLSERQKRSIVEVPAFLGSKVLKDDYPELARFLLLDSASKTNVELTPLFVDFLRHHIARHGQDTSFLSSF